MSHSTLHRHPDSPVKSSRAAALTDAPANGESQGRARDTNGAPARAGYWFTLTAVGVVGGVLSGLFAVGGGILMVPLLIWRAGMDQRRAAATSLVAIVPTALVSSVTYLINGQVDVTAAVLVALGAVAGALVGTRMLRQIPVPKLRWMFVVFILLIAARLLVISPHRGDHGHLTALVAVGFVGVGLVMGLASGLFGIGGGIIAVPLMISLFAVSDLVAKGTSLLVSVPTSVVGTLSNRRAGFVDVQAGLVVGLAAAVASVPAVALSLQLSARLSGQLFAGLLVLVAVQIGIKTIREQASR